MSDRPTCKCRSCMAPQTLVMRLDLAAALTSRRARFRFETLGPSEVTLFRWGERAPKEARDAD